MERCDLKECPKCGRPFPEHLIQQMMIDGAYLLVCPLCALEITNEVHGLPPGTLFRGEQAKQNYDEALQYLYKDL